MTIQLGKGTRHAGLIDPGDRVDVILTAKLALDGGVQSVFTRRILEDVRVVAVDRELGAAAGAAQPNDPIKRTSISTATLEVSPAQADLLALGEHQGTLALAVRSLAARAGTAGGEAVNLRQLLGHPLSERAEPPGERIELEAPALAEPQESEFASPKTVRVIRGSELTPADLPRSRPTANERFAARRASRARAEPGGGRSAAGSGHGSRAVTTMPGSGPNSRRTRWISLNSLPVG